MPPILLALSLALADDTTRAARELLEAKLGSVGQTSACALAFAQEKVDLERVRSAARRARFYSAEGPEGRLSFSQVVRTPARPDPTLRSLARQLPENDAFVLGYQVSKGYVRTPNVVLNRGYFLQAGRLTTREEKQSLLLHEILHLALDIDDDNLARLQVCPLRELAACGAPQPPASD